LIKVGELPSVSQKSFENVRVARWFKVARNRNGGRCDRNGRFRNKVNTEFKAKECEKKLRRLYRRRELPQEASYEKRTKEEICEMNPESRSYMRD